MNWRKWSYYGLLAAFVFVFLFSAGRLAAYFWDAQQSQEQLQEVKKLYRATPQNNPPIKTVFKPETQESEQKIAPPLPATVSVPESHPDKAVIQERFNPLLKVNDDVIGWVRIEDTVIDYPVVQSDDNEYYLLRDLHKKENVNGSIFMDYRNRIEQPAAHWILYGHNMKNKTMFMALLNYESRWYFDNHSIIQFDTLYDDKKWQVFSAYFTDTNDDYLRTDFHDDGDFLTFIQDLQGKSLHRTDTELSANDTILTLSTCSNSNDDARFVVHAKLIE
ncbi:class B sortase [Cohnella luojiensis]|uniref:Class B sortase n=1 Tax=Cohnella luojiensis TaxID=652876 RepID=A0A4Y8M2T3_9BACL|nr:class B sortase [Cohnella luojiensis]TFE26315.1 class B sortase [Cohnella luojiensis]